MEESKVEGHSGTRQKSDSEKALHALRLCMLIGVGGIVIYAIQSWSLTLIISIGSIGIMVAGAALFVGGLLGFLFGIPRTLQHDVPLKPAAGEQIMNPSETEVQQVAYGANTNLEQISDWFTKILVGVGLTQITVIPGKLQRVAEYMASGLGNSDSSRIFAFALLIYFLVSGFLFGYLWTRLYLGSALRQADLSALGAALANRVEQATQQVDKKLDEFKKQAELDALALTRAARQLNPSPGDPDISQEDLNKVFKESSPAVQAHIFNQAQVLRSQNWHEERTKPIMERTIPIFRALIASAPERQFHRNHAQLGYALKDKLEPDWVEAEAELSTAIEIRDQRGELGWLFYEFNRAICRMMRDEAFKQGKMAQPEVRDGIAADLRAAAQSELKKLILSEADMKRWLDLNKIRL